MKQTSIITLFFALLAATTLYSCKKDALSVKETKLGVTLVNPKGLKDVKLNDIILKFKEVNSGVETSASLAPNGELNATLPEGSYDVTLEGAVEYTEDDKLFTGKVRGFKEGLVTTGETMTFSIDLFLYNEDANFVLKEIYFTGSVTPEGKQYNGDKYFIIYNNSADTLYADRLIIAQSSFLTTTKRIYTPDVMNEAFTTGQMVMIPGSGKEHPVAPGGQFIVANNAINHLEYNSRSTDLRKSDFEIELLSSINVDNPEVPNTISLAGFMTMHNRGFQSFVLAKLPDDIGAEDFKTENFYSYSYIGGTGNTMTAEAYKIPNSYILDAVNLSVAASFEWIVTSPALDMGWTYCGKLASDPDRYGKAVARKVLSTNPDGRVILKDTNNSTVDFEPESKPSL